MDTANKIKEESRVWLASIVSQDIKLIKAGNLKIKQSKPCGRCQNQQEVLQEKGVDVRLAVDVLEDVYEASLSSVGLLSSDTDLCLVIHKAVAKSVKVIYICFANGLNRAVAAASSETITISAEKVKKYFLLIFIQVTFRFFVFNIFYNFINKIFEKIHQFNGYTFT